MLGFQLMLACCRQEWHSPETVDPRCHPGNAWVNSVTVATSTDGGRRFAHPADYKIRSPAPWRKGFFCCSPSCSVQFGSFEPSNIVAKGKYFYALFNYISAPVTNATARGLIQGTCIMRTAELGKGSAWKVWTANASWGREEDCTPIVSEDIKTFSYNTYLRRYMGVGYQGSTMGYVLSEDLLSWSAFVPFFSVPIPQGASS